MNIADTYEALGLSKRELERLTGISYSQWWRYETTRGNVPAVPAEYLNTLLFLKEHGMLENYFSWRINHGNATHE